MTDQTSETTPDGLDVAAVRERVEAATTASPYLGGVWEYDDEPDGDGIVWARDQVMGDPVAASAHPEVATFIAHARTDIPLLLTALDEARREVKSLKSGSRCPQCSATEWNRASIERARAEAAESARDAAEGVVREVRARAERLADAIQAVQEDRGWKHNEGCEGEPDCFACIELDLRRLAPVTTDATEGEA